ncbi:unnamed protein product [Arctia plantaginis]|uniref:Uncharacterized protein n=1 Tax=Arctia plantaginis TaxID=874455 RepID=A0A8S1BMC0_ARCPL|nr:unnamed protein product [Arctia plantaginis]
MADISTQESVQLEDLFKMREQLHKHEQLRMQEQLKMQQELLQKQELWMQQQLQKKPLLRMPQEEVTTVDEWKFTQIYADEPKTTEDKFETVPSVELLKEDTTERPKSKKKRRHKKRMSHRHHKPKQTREDSLQEIFTTVSKQHHEKETVETTTENIFNTLSSQKEDFNTTPVPHKIKYNIQVQVYSLQILEIGMQVFDEMKNKTIDETIKTKLQDLSDIYAYKYKEFLSETYKHEIKTRLGIQKVFLNAIDVSDHILKRLVNGVVTDLDNRGSLRENIGAINDLQQEVRQTTDRQYQLLCSKLNICRSNNGFPEFLSDFLTTILRCNDEKFQNAIDALTEVAKEVDFKNVFNKKTRKQIKIMIEHVENQKVGVLKPSLLIIRNIIANKNKPIVVKPSEMKNNRVNSTIAFLEILDAFDIKLPRTDANILEWGDLRTSLHQWGKNKRNDIQDIMGIFIRHIKGALEGMPSLMQDHVAKNFARFLRRH